MNPFTYIIIALIIIYILSYITKKATKLLIYTIISLFGFLFIMQFSKNMYTKLSTNTNDEDE